MVASYPTHHEAERKFFGDLQEAIGCIAECVVVVASWTQERVGVLMSRDGGNVGVEGIVLPGPGDLKLHASWYFTVSQKPDQTWSVSVAAYMCYIDAPGGPIVDYHWHPVEGPTHPHVHVGPLTLAEGVETPPDGLVFETPHLPFEAIVRQLIEQFGVVPRHTEWDATLDRLETKFHTMHP